MERALFWKHILISFLIIAAVVLLCLLLFFAGKSELGPTFNLSIIYFFLRCVFLCLAIFIVAPAHFLYSQHKTDFFFICLLAWSIAWLGSSPFTCSFVIIIALSGCIYAYLIYWLLLVY